MDLVQTAIWTNTLIFVLVVVILLNTVTRGFLFTFLEAKMSRGKKKLIKVYTVVDVYFKVAKIQNGQLTYTTRGKLNGKKEKKTLDIEKAKAWDFLGVKCFETNEETDSLINKDFKAVQGVDATVQDRMIAKVMQQPSLNNDERMLKLLKIALFAIVVVVFGLLIVGYQVFTLKDLILGMTGAKAVI